MVTSSAGNEINCKYCFENWTCKLIDLINSLGNGSIFSLKRGEGGSNLLSDIPEAFKNVAYVFQITVVNYERKGLKSFFNPYR